MISDPNVVAILYLVTIACFVVSLKFLSSPRHARKGNWIGGLGMLFAIGTTLLLEGLENWLLIVVALVIGSVVGLIGARSVRMTAMPQMVAIFNGVGGGAAALVALSEWHNTADPLREETVSIVLSALIGSISFAGSVVAFAKLQELLSGRPIVFTGQNIVNVAVLGGAAVLGAAAVAGLEEQWVLYLLISLALFFGVMFVLPIGGADMPVVISLLNAFTGLSAAAAGMALDNTALIVAGMLVGASGSILTKQMAEAMNRSIGNVFFSGFGAGGGGAVTTDDGALAERVRLLRNYGSPAKYEHDVLGFNSRLDGLQAACLAVKLRHLADWNARRRAIAAHYLEALGDLDGLVLPRIDADAESVWHLFVVRHADRDALQGRLAERGVQTLIHYPIPPHRTGAYAAIDAELPVTDRLADEVLSLPLHPHLNATQLARVVAAVRATAGR